MARTKQLPYRQVLAELFEVEAPHHGGIDGINMPALRSTLWLRLATEYPEMAQVVPPGVARDLALKQLVDWFVRHAKRDYLTGVQANRMRYGQMRVFVRVPDAEHQFRTQPRTALRRDDLRALVEYHAMLGKSHQREARWCNWVLKQMNALGLPDDAVAGDVLRTVEQRKAA